MKKKNNFRFLSVWLLMSMLFGISWSSWAAESDVIESITDIGSYNFVIKRSDASAATIVNYRTMDGSALGGVHYEQLSGQLYFQKGEYEKTVHIDL